MLLKVDLEKQGQYFITGDISQHWLYVFDRLGRA